MKKTGSGSSYRGRVARFGKVIARVSRIDLVLIRGGSADRGVRPVCDRANRRQKRSIAKHLVTNDADIIRRRGPTQIDLSPARRDGAEVGRWERRFDV